jgi:hypothetical protein
MMMKAALLLLALFVSSVTAAEAQRRLKQDANYQLKSDASAVSTLHPAGTKEGDAGRMIKLPAGTSFKVLVVILMTQKDSDYTEPYYLIKTNSGEWWITNKNEVEEVKP